MGDLGARYRGRITASRVIGVESGERETLGSGSWRSWESWEVDGGTGGGLGLVETFWGDGEWGISKREVGEEMRECGVKFLFFCLRIWKNKE